MKYYVYCCYSETTALYVGVSSNPDRRLMQHANNSHWWEDTKYSVISLPMTKSLAYRRERELIIEKQPTHNKVKRRALKPISKEIDLHTRAAFAAWGKQGGYARNKGKTKEQRSAIAKKAWATRRANAR